MIQKKGIDNKVVRVRRSTRVPVPKPITQEVTLTKPKKVKKQSIFKDTGKIVDSQNEHASILSASTFSQAASQIILDLVNSDSNLKISIEDTRN